MDALMPDFRIEIKNYRCFPDSHPLRLDIRRGFSGLVGINNAGKSSILRLFWELRSLFGHFSSPIGNLINGLNGQPQGIGGPSVAAGEEAFSKLNDRPIELTITWQGKTIPDEVLSEHELTLTIDRGGNYLPKLRVGGVDIRRDTNMDFDRNVLRVAGNPVIDLEGLFDACRFLSGGMYLGPFRNTINVGGERYFDIAVGQQFTQQFREFKSGSEPRANEAVYQLIQDIKRIFAFDELDINPDPDGKTLQVFIEGRSFRLSELGTGMAQFILVLANVLVRRPTFVLIDEPEASLHPTLQLDFLTTLASYTTEATVFFATHNLGLARAAADRIYSCRRLDLGVSEVRDLEATPRLAEFVGELGFSAYRDLGFNKIVLVEGPSDVKTVQQFLRLWRKDHDVVLLPLGGTSMINANAENELLEMSRISSEIYAVVDSERSSEDEELPAERAAFAETCARLGIHALVLSRRAIENYLTDDAVKAGLGHQFAALGPYQTLKEAPLGWAKRDNWLAARRMSAADLGGTDLGEFLDAL
jgi:ABC-type cobalamin/Fe3+-siderophores transport system ATPase subunit